MGGGFGLSFTSNFFHVVGRISGKEEAGEKVLWLNCSHYKIKYQHLKIKTRPNNYLVTLFLS